MLNSWFGSKGHDKGKEPSGSTDLHRIFTNDTDVPDEPARRIPPTGFTSPHDAVLAQMLGEPHIEDTGDGLLREDVPATPNSEPAIDAPSPTGSTARESVQQEILYDPFDGTPLGLLSPSQRLLEVGTGAMGPPPQPKESGSKEEQWLHLSRVLDLQNEVAKMHLEMEGVGLGDRKGKAVKGRGRGKGIDTNARERKEWGDNGRQKPRRSSTVDSVGADAHGGDEEGVDAAGDEEIEMKKAREEHFASLADQFEGRKESIQEIMSKLDDLSKALTEFHTLQAPTFEFSKAPSRQNSTTPDISLPQAQVHPHIKPKIPPYASATLPNVGLTSLPNARFARPALPAIQSPSLSTAALHTLGPFEQESNLIPVSLSRAPAPGKTKDPVASLIVNALEPGKQTHVMDSPDSMRGHIKLPPEL